MRCSILVSTIVSLAVCGAVRAQDATQPAAMPAAAPTTMPARTATEVPITEIALFNSGVGFFKHAGSVDGDAYTDLHFKTDQINDILKSLVLQDSGGGRIGTVTYPSQEPVERTLHSFQIDISSDPPLELLLQQLRGAHVLLVHGDEKVSGQIIGLQQKERSLKDADGAKIIHPWFINILSGSDIHSIALDDVGHIELLEPDLQKDFQEALSVLGKSRDQDKKTVTVNFDGKGKRNVMFAYLVETPIWKTTYRLIVPEMDAAGNLKDPNAKPILQGWALVENQTDADWSDIKLALIGGHPISFIENLYQSLYIPRPIFVPEFIGSLSPQTYAGGNIATAGSGEVQPPQFNLQQITQNGQQGGAGGGGGLFNQAGGAGQGSQLVHLGGGQPAAGALGGVGPATGAGFNPAEGVSTIADTSKIGELFQYAIDHVTLRRGQSAMIPILTDPVEVQQVSIFDSTVLPRNPLYGARLKNTTGKYLLGGPITVISSGNYSGDAQVEDIGPGHSRLLSYGVDQDMQIDTKAADENTLESARILNGQLILNRKDVATTNYAVRNASDMAKTLIIVQARNANDKLLEPAGAVEKTDSDYRLELPTPAHKTTTLKVVVQNGGQELFDIVSLKMDELDARIHDLTLPQKIRDALTEVMNKIVAIQQSQGLLVEKKTLRAGIAGDQERIRDDIKVADKADAIYQRLETKLNDQETQIESLDKDMADLQADITRQQKDFKDYMAKLTVE